MSDPEYEKELRDFAGALMRGERPRRPDTPEDRGLRGLARTMFGREPEPEPEPEIKQGNYVPRAGANPRPPSGRNSSGREFVRALFERPWL